MKNNIAFKTLVSIPFFAISLFFFTIILLLFLQGANLLSHFLRDFVLFSISIFLMGLYILLNMSKEVEKLILLLSILLNIIVVFLFSIKVFPLEGIVHFLYLGSTIFHLGFVLFFFLIINHQLFNKESNNDDFEDILDV